MFSLNQPQDGYAKVTYDTSGYVENAADALDQLKAQLPRLTLSETVDIAAKLRSVINSAEELDKIFKEQIKATLRHLPGEIKGDLFKAVLNIVHLNCLDQKALKEKEPEIYGRYLVPKKQEPVTFKVR